MRDLQVNRKGEIRSNMHNIRLVYKHGNKVDIGTNEVVYMAVINRVCVSMILVRGVLLIKRQKK